MRPGGDPKVIAVGNMAVTMLNACYKGSPVEPKKMAGLVKTTADILGIGAQYLFASLKRGIDDGGFDLEPVLEAAIKHGVRTWLSVPGNWGMVSRDASTVETYAGFQTWASSEPAGQTAPAVSI